jgi:LacI family transcriptional regulator
MSTWSPLPQIAVLVETSTSWGAQVVQGVAQYARDHGSWSLFVQPRGISERLDLPARWRGSGVIARIISRQLAKKIASLGLPCVNVSWSEVPGAPVPRVTSDEVSIGKLAAQHLIDQGYRQFAYLGLGHQANRTDHLGPAFVEHLAERGYLCTTYRESRRGVLLADSWSELPALTRWLADRPKPLGILGWNSQRGHMLTEACARTNWLVPEEVGVIIAYNDDICEVATPLSAVDTASTRIGYEAASLLSVLIAGSTPPKLHVLVPPAGVTTRCSTDPAAVDDPLVAGAVKFIRQHAHQAISVEDVLAAFTVSRRNLELHFIKVLGRSPAAEIRRARVKHAMNLLSQTDLPIHQIAAASGFNHNQVMNSMFRREVGMTPSAYRYQARPQRSPRHPRSGDRSGEIVSAGPIAQKMK